MSTPVISSLASVPKTETSKTNVFSSHNEGSFVFDFKATANSPFSQAKTKPDDHELDIFVAEKYLKDGLNLKPNRVSEVGKRSFSFQTPRNVVVVDDDQLSVGDQSGVHSVSGSSRNSRSSLLHSNNRHKRSSTYRDKFKAAIGCKCYCTDRNSVDVDDYVPEKSSTHTRKLGSVMKQADKNGDHLVGKLMSVKFEEPELGVNSFSFPVFSPIIGDGRASRRISLDLRSPTPENGKNHRQSQEETISFPPTSTNESDSDASSDLFELESLKKDGNHLLPRQESDDFSGNTTPGNGYAPSEASIEWSVITASAADFSVMSDTEDSTAKSGTKTGVANSKTVSGTPKFRPINLSGCRSHKSLGVVGDAHRTNDPKVSKQQKPQSCTQKTSHEGSKLNIIYSRNLPETCYSRVLS